MKNNRTIFFKKTTQFIICGILVILAGILLFSVFTNSKKDAKQLLLSYQQQFAPIFSEKIDSNHPVPDLEPVYRTGLIGNKIDYYQANNQDFAIKIPAGYQEPLVFNKNGYALDIIPKKAKDVQGESLYQQASFLYILNSKEQASRLYALIYKDVYNSTDIVKRLTPYGIKETIILKSKKAPKQFEWLLNLPDGVEPEKDSQGSIRFFRKTKEEDEFLFQIPYAFMMDTLKKYSADCHWDINRVNGNQYKLVLICNSADLTYPVAIDPTLTTQLHYWWRNDNGFEGDFGGDGAVVSDYSTGSDYLYAIASDSEYIYTAGSCYSCGNLGSFAWLIEKRRKSDGQLDPNFGNSGVVISDPSSGTDEARAITLDSSYIYVAGYCTDCGPATGDYGSYAWHIEKRSIVNGALDSGFGQNSSVTVDVGSSYDIARAITLDSSYIYTAGYCTDCGPATGDYGSYAWHIEKRSIVNGALDSGFGTNSSVTSDVGSGDDRAQAITLDSSYIYTAGFCNNCGPATGDYGGFAWHIEKRSITNGALDSGFGTNSSVTSDVGSSTDEAYAITLDSSYIYVAGYCNNCGPATGDYGSYAWHIEKRSIVNGALDSGFGQNSSVTVDVGSSGDYAQAITLDSSYIYVAGYQGSGGQLGSNAWRLEKRSVSDGSLYNGASWKTTEPDTAVTDQAKETNIRLRFQVNVASASLSNAQLQLQSAPKGAYSTCEDVPSSSYDDVPTTASTSIAQMASSTYFANQASTSQQMGPYFFVEDLTKNADYAYAIASDSEYIYIAGSCYGCGSAGGYAWQIEKRRKTDGKLDPNFGNSGVVISDPGSGTDYAYSITLDSSYIYIAGTCYNCGPATGDYGTLSAWHIEKRSIVNGALDSGFGTNSSVTSDVGSDWDYAKSITLDSSYIYVAGYCNNCGPATGDYGNTSAWHIEKRSIVNGALDSGFGTNSSVTVDVGPGSDEAYSIFTDGTYIYTAGMCNNCGPATGDYGATYAWHIEKRSIVNGSLDSGFGQNSSITSDVGSGTDYAYSITTDSSYIYTAGYQGGVDWRIEKRSKTNGSYDTNFGSPNGYVTSNPGGTDYALSITADSNYIYTAGYCTNCGPATGDYGATYAWHIEKRSIVNGALDSGFGQNSSVTLDPTNSSDYAQSIVTDGSYIYTAGYQYGGGQLGDYAWRVEKRNADTGRIDNFQDSNIVEAPSNLTDAIETMASPSFTEVEFNFQLSTNAGNSTSYCFRVTNNGAPLDVYSKVAEITTQAGGEGIIRAKGGVRLKGNTRLK